MSKFLDKNIHNAGDIGVISSFLALLWFIAVSEASFQDAMGFIEDKEYSPCNECCEMPLNCTCPKYNEDEAYDRWRDRDIT
jgi:hypothetical protein